MSAPLDRFNRHWVRDGECWRWTGAKDTGGYGNINVGGKFYKAHRLGYQMLVGPIPKGFELDHLCRNRWCVNPDHMEVITHAENVARSNNPAHVSHRTGICKRGHSLADAIRASNGHVSHCRTCRRQRARDRYHSDPAFHARELERGVRRRQRLAV